MTQPVSVPTSAPGAIPPQLQAATAGLNVAMDVADQQAQAVIDLLQTLVASPSGAPGSQVNLYI